MLAASSSIALANGCSATPHNATGQFTTSMGSGGATGTGGSGGAHETTASSGGTMGVGGIILMNPDGGDASDAVDEQIVNPCGSKCGPVELCDEAHLGLVDEGCSCQAGQAHSCFKGDPSYEHVDGCHDGTEVCSEQGHWSDCVGGVHATDGCFQNNPNLCHAITALPFANTHLKPGTQMYSANAVAGSETFSVQCPIGVSPCPMVIAPDQFTALQSGEYTVTYTKTVQGDPNPQSCTYPLFVGAPGLRIELSWEHPMMDMNDTGVDLDLHVHQPMNTMPWGITPPVAEDCTWSNCVFIDFDPPQGFDAPKWFADDPPAMPPTPVNWYNDMANPANNTCYNDPKGVGSDWASLGMGCHNPRLDSDNIFCDAAVLDPNDPNFCAPENINIDYPPTGQWTRIGVHYYSNHGLNYDVHPRVKVFCNGSLSADLGPSGYYVSADPDAGPTPVTFEPSDGAGFPGNRFWVVADVAFTNDPCGKALCTVKPVYSDPVQKTPFFTIDDAATASFAPAYPPAP